MAEDTIRESELIQLDGTIDELIKQLQSLNTVYGETIATIRTSAESLARSLRSISGATVEGRRSIDAAASAASRYERAEQELAFALSETGKQVAWLKAQTSDVNRATVEQQRQINAATTSYNRLKSDIKELVTLYKSLTQAEREDAQFGEQVLAELQNKNNELKKLNTAMRGTVTEMTRLQKAEQELAYWQSEEGQALLKVKQQIREVTSANKEHRVAVDDVTRAEEKLNKARASVNVHIKELNIETKKANTLASIQARLNKATAGSYESLSAQYDLLKFKSKELNLTTEDGRRIFEAYAKEMGILRGKMQSFQEATGVYSLNVGNYKSVWSGLGYSVQQIVREIPSAAISLNTFFLAISNNIPILIDEIRRFKISGKTMTETIKEVAKAFFSWQTVLVIVLGVLSKYGSTIIQFAKDMFNGTNAVKIFNKALKAVNKEMLTTNNSYGKHMLTIRKLRDEYLALSTEEEKTEWLKKNEDAWRDLNVAMTGVSDADNFFINNTANVVEAFRLRAKAAAANSLAEKAYEKRLKEEIKLKEAKDEGVGAFENVITVTSGTAALTGATSTTTPQEMYEARIKEIEYSISLIDAEIDAYYDLAKAANTAADAIVGTYTPKEKEKAGTKTSTGKDLEKYLESARISVTKKTEEAITNIQADEFEKRRKKAIKDYEVQVLELQKIYSENERYLTGEYTLKEPMTEAQKAELENMQKRIKTALDDYKTAFDKTISDISVDERIASLKTAGDIIQLRLDAVKKNSNEEFELRKTLLEQQMAIELAENEKAVGVKKKNEKDIIAKWDKEIEALEYEHFKVMLEKRKKDLDTMSEYVELDSKNELEIMLEQLELERLAAKKANEQLADELKTDSAIIDAYYDKQKLLIAGAYELAKARTAATLKTTGIVSAAASGDKLGASTTLTYGMEGSRKREVYNIDVQILDIERQLKLVEEGKLDLTQEQIADLMLQNALLKKQKTEMSGIKGVISDIGQFGISGGILGALGFDSDAINAFNNITNEIIANINEILEAEVQLAEKEVELAEQRVDAAKSAYEAEIEARNNGYANSVDTARKELQEERRRQAEKQKLLEEAQRRQEAVNTITQASSLITAAAQIWSTMSGYSIIGPILAAAAIATMFSSFAYAKVKARQVTASAEYGEGGLEFLEGGSHASGDDIDLHTKNKKGQNMRAEGGEALAIINKKNTRKYKAILPEIIDSLNSGTFQDKFSQIFNPGAIGLNVVSQSDKVDLSTIETGLEGIRKQNEVKTIVLSDGTIIMQTKNTRRIIHKS